MTTTIPNPLSWQKRMLVRVLMLLASFLAEDEATRKELASLTNAITTSTLY